MSELNNLQKTIQQEEVNQTQSSQQDALQDEVLVDTMVVEDTDALTDRRSSAKRGNDHLQEDVEESEVQFDGITNLFAADLFEEGDAAPPMIQALQILSRLLDAGVAERALAQADEGALAEVRTSLLQLVENGLNPMQIQLFATLSQALKDGKARIESGKVETELIGEDVSDIQSIVDSALVATDAMHSEIWEQEDETLLAFQNLSLTEADEVQDDLGSLDENTISAEDRQVLLSEGITAIEIEEVLVDFWTAAQNPEYVLEEDTDV